MNGILVFNWTKSLWIVIVLAAYRAHVTPVNTITWNPFYPKVFLRWLSFHFDFWTLCSSHDIIFPLQLCIRIQRVALAHGSSDSCFEVNNMHQAPSSFFIHILQKYNSNRRFDLCSYVGDVSWAPYSRYPSTCPHTLDWHNCPIFGFTLRLWDLLWSLLRAQLTVSKLALSLPPCPGMAGSLCLTSPQTSTLLSAGYSLISLESCENYHKLGGIVQESFMFHYL